MSNAESIKEMADMAYALGTTHDPEQPSQQPSEGRVEATSVDEALGQLWAALEEARGNVEKARALSTGARPDGWSVGRLFTGELHWTSGMIHADNRLRCNRNACNGSDLRDPIAAGLPRTSSWRRQSLGLAQSPPGLMTGAVRLKTRPP